MNRPKHCLCSDGRAMVHVTSARNIIFYVKIHNVDVLKSSWDDNTCTGRTKCCQSLKSTTRCGLKYCYWY